MKRVIFIFALTFLECFSIFSQTTVAIELHNNSFITINGTTNLLSFRLFQKGKDLLNKTFTLTATQNHNRIYISQNQIAIPVRKFNSENKMALHDFLKLIKSNDYPDLLIQLNYLEANQSNDKRPNSRGSASVDITITGVTKKFDIPVTSKQAGDMYSIDGEKNINIRDFGLTPPVEMMGLIKVSEWIDIHFHFIGKMKLSKSLAINK
jgi:hypothetical protein